MASVNKEYNVRLQVFTALTTKITIFWVWTPYNSVHMYRSFRSICCLYNVITVSPETSVFLLQSVASNKTFTLKEKQAVVVTVTNNVHIFQYEAQVK